LAYFREAMHKNNMQSKKMLKFRFIVLLCIAFLFQQVSFATEQNTIGLSSQHYGVTQNNYFEKGNTENQEPQLHLFVEAESEDEDDIHNEQVVCNDFISSNQNLTSVHYTDIISKLYLKLASTNQHKVDLPFFILYHCWKSYLA
jgi:hypothetical protein